MDSGSKALEVLGLMEDQDISSPASTYKNQIEVNLVITDCCMPGMTGYDLLKKIKKKSKKEIHLTNLYDRDLISDDIFDSMDKFDMVGTTKLERWFFFNVLSGFKEINSKQLVRSFAILTTFLARSRGNN
ncbi:unnamed protein product [Musa hybrid cultivar]